MRDENTGTRTVLNPPHKILLIPKNKSYAINEYDLFFYLLLFSDCIHFKTLKPFIVRSSEHALVKSIIHNHVSTSPFSPLFP